MLISVCVLTSELRLALTDKGGNPSAEEVEEALESGAQQVNNVVHSFRLSQTSFDKKVCQSPAGRPPPINGIFNNNR